MNDAVAWVFAVAGGFCTLWALAVVLTNEEARRDRAARRIRRKQDQIIKIRNKWGL